MKQDIENIIKKNLPEPAKGIEKVIENTEQDRIYNLLNENMVIGFNQALSQIPVSLIADEVLKVFEEEKYGLLKKYSQWLEKHSYMDCDWWAEIPCSVDRFLEELSLSLNKENEIEEIPLFNGTMDKLNKLSVIKENKNNER